MAGAGAKAKVPLIVFNSDHVTPPDGTEGTHRPASPQGPPAYSVNRREWSGNRSEGHIDWIVQGPDSVQMGHRIDLMAKVKIAKGCGVVDSATVSLVQVEKYQAEPDPTVWTYPVEPLNDGDDLDSSSDDGFPEVRTSGVKLKHAASFDGGIATTLRKHSREKVSFSRFQDFC